MKIFVDTANIEEIKKSKSLGILDGVTTNPSLIAKCNKPMEECIKEIITETSTPISVEVNSYTFNEMIKEATTYAKWGDNIVIKVPINLEGLKVITELSKQNIKVNATLCFSPIQALLAAKAGAFFISPFVGRLDDIVLDGMDLIAQITKIYKNYDFNTKVLVASTRNPIHIVKSALLAADIVTVPYKIIKLFLKHPLTDIGLKKFLVDWEKSKT